MAERRGYGNLADDSPEYYVPLFLRHILWSLARGVGYAVLSYLFQLAAVGPPAPSLTMAKDLALNGLAYATIDFMIFSLIRWGRKRYAGDAQGRPQRPSEWGRF